MSKYKINPLFSEVLVDDGVLLLSESTTDFYYLGEFESKLWQMIKDEPNDYEMVLQRLSESCENFDLEDFELFWNDLMHSEIIMLEKA